MAEAKITLERLNNSNWASWKFRMELLLVKEDLWSVVTAKKPENPDAAWKTKDGKARAAIGLALENSQLSHVIGVDSANEMWAKLKGYHQRGSLSNKIHVLRKLLSLRLSEGGDMSEHLLEASELVHRMAAMGEALKEHWVVAILLSSIPESYSPLITALEGRKEEELNADYVKGKLLDEWRRRCENNSSEEKALKSVVTNEKQKTKKPRAKPKCWYCNQEGHLRHDCSEYLAEKENNKSSGSGEKQKAKTQKAKVAVVEEQSDPDDICFLATSAAGSSTCWKTGQAGSSSGKWLLDSGCSKHMTGKAELVQNTVACESSVCLADGKKLFAEGIGQAKIAGVGASGKSKAVSMKDVLFVPGLAGNLLSVSRIVDEGFVVVFAPGECKIMKGGRTVLVGERSGDLFSIKQPEVQANLSTVAHKDSCQHLWHRRLGHRHPGAIQRIEREDLGDDLSVEDCGIRSVCGICCEGKMAREPFPPSQSESSAVLDLVHSDLCGPLEVPTPRGNRYIMTMIDDFSRYTVVYLLKAKSEAYEKIRHYVALVQNKFDKKPGVLRTDNGGEYTSKMLKAFLDENGIRLQLTAPYTPQQNGKSERKNRVLIEMTRCLLSEANLDKKYWGEAVMTACYLHNRLPSAVIDRTPYERWLGEKPEYGHLRVFGCNAWVHVPTEKRRKLDKKAVKLVFVGYAEDRKAYRFLNVETNSVTVSRDAKFLENEMNTKESIREVVQPMQRSVGVSLESRKTQERNPVENNPSESNPEEAQGGAPLEADSSVDCFEEAIDHLSDSSEDGFAGDSEDEGPFKGFPPEPRRSQRSTKGVPPQRLLSEANNACLVAETEPQSVDDVEKSPHAQEWYQAIKDEMESHAKNGTWELVKLPPGKKPIGSKWVYKTKCDASGNVIKYKARLVAQGFTQKPGVDYEEIYAPVTSQITFRALLAIASQKGITLQHWDVKTAYLHGKIEEELYMCQPQGFIEEANKDLVCRIRRSIYGLKQSARCWNLRLHEILTELEFKRSSADNCLYTKSEGGETEYLLVYVDDIVVGCVQKSLVDRTLIEMKRSLDITSLGDIHFFLGMEVQRTNGKYSLSLQSYIERTADKFGLGEVKPAKTPMDEGYLKLEGDEPLKDSTIYRSLLGALLYVAVHARPDIAVSTSILGRRVSQPTEHDWTAAKRVVRYLLATKDKRLQFTGDDAELVGYSDADWAGDVRTRKSTTGFTFIFGGAAISWISRKQTSVTLSSMEAEYIALSQACQEVIWMRKLLQDLNVPQKQPTVIYEDNQSCISFVKSERSTRRSKHIETREKFVKELFTRGTINLIYCPTERMAADVLTKPLGKIKLDRFSTKLGLSPRTLH